MADISVTFRTLIEDAPGPQWQALFERLWPAYRSWFLRSGAVGRPTYLESRRALREHMCSPCCHKELRPQLLSPHPLRPILKHGVHLGQQAEMLTDGLRAMLLDACGYDTQVFEFVSLEHTNKNKMILAVKREAARDADADTGAIWRQVREVKDFYGIRDQCLERLLLADREAAAA